MTKITDTIKIEVELTASEALKARIVLGRTNGCSGNKLYNELVRKLDPKSLFDPFSTNESIGNINYRYYEQMYENHFFGLYNENRRKALVDAEKELAIVLNRITQLKNELGEENV